MTVPRAVVRQQLSQSELLAGLPDAALADLATRVLGKSLASGSRLCRAGDEGNSAFLVISGRLRAEVDGRLVGEIGRGELVGEISLLTGEPRSADVVAARDSEILELPGEVFNEVLASYPDCYQAVSRQLVSRLQRVLTSTERTARATVLALLHDGHVAAEVSMRAFIAQLGSEVATVESRSVDISTLEASNEVVVIAAAPDDSELWDWAVGQCDRVLLFVDASAKIPRSRIAPLDRPFELVLVHPASADCPAGTAQWIDLFKPTAHHHIRHGSRADLDRVNRRLCHAENVLVMSGGGARGLAHAGLFRSLADHEVPIDAVLGVSAGAVGAAVIGMGLSPEEGGTLATRLFSEGGSPIDLTVPTVAMASGARINERLKKLCGEHRQLEDLWLPTTIVSTNLTTAAMHLHHQGSLWRAVRASTAIPGVFPPVAEPAGLLVDGGIVANLPIEVVRRLHPGATVIASDVGKKMQLLPDHFPDEAELSGWQAVRSRVGRGNRLPGMVRILAQLTALGGGGEARGDLHFEFDLDEFGMFDFKKGPAIIEAGHTQSLERVAAWAEATR